MKAQLALSVRQPFAHLIATGRKTIETRSWAPPESSIGVRLAIHAAKAPADEDLLPPLLDALLPDDWRDTGPFGAAICEVTLAEVVPIVVGTTADPPLPAVQVYGPGSALIRRGGADSSVDDQLPYGFFHDGWFAWRLTDVAVYDEPIPMVGRQRLWRPGR